MRLPYFNFMKWRRVALAVAAIIIVSSIVLLFTKGLNLGIDFNWRQHRPGRVHQAVEVRISGHSDIQEQGSALIQAYSDTGVIIR